jgi:ubiquinone/menaquinone biosynthesis C-methylase UbiE
LLRKLAERWPANPLGKLKVYGTWAAIRGASRLINMRNAGDAPPLPPVQDHRAGEGSEVEGYWTSHTVLKSQFGSQWESDRYFELLCRMHPLLSTLMEFDVPRDQSRVLDYGCGPGNDVYRLLARNRARRVAAVDVSPTAIDSARARISLYRDAASRVDFHLVSDQTTDLPFEANSFDHINCAGVLMHTSFPERILKEFYRALEPGGDALVMVYVRPSIFFDLYIPFYWQRLRGRWQGLSTEEAFRRGTDGEACPISRCYRVSEFSSIAESAGFSVEYRGGYFEHNELWLVRKYLNLAISDQTMPVEHREFLSSLTMDSNGHPLRDGKFAGVSGVFRLTKH